MSEEERIEELSTCPKCGHHGWVIGLLHTHVENVRIDGEPFRIMVEQEVRCPSCDRQAVLTAVTVQQLGYHPEIQEKFAVYDAQMVIKEASKV